MHIRSNAAPVQQLLSQLAHIAGSHNKTNGHTNLDVLKL